MTTPDVLIIDWGTDSWKVGLAGRGPPATLPSPPGAVSGGAVADWSAFRTGVLQAFALLDALPEECRVLFSAPHGYPGAAARRLRSVALDLGSPAAHVAETPLLCLRAAGLPSGVVIDVGHSTTTLTTVLNGDPVAYASATRAGGGAAAVDALAAGFLARHGGAPLTAAEARAILRGHGEVAENPTELAGVVVRARKGQLPPVWWRRQQPGRGGEGETFDVAGLAAQACEGLFEPAGLNLGSMAHECVARLFSTDFKAYSEICPHVLVCGGGGDATGIVERLRHELRPWPKLRVAACGGAEGRRRVFAAWYGAERLVQQPEFAGLCGGRAPTTATATSAQLAVLTALPPSPRPQQQQAGFAGVGGEELERVLRASEDEEETRAQRHRQRHETLAHAVVKVVAAAARGGGGGDSSNAAEATEELRGVVTRLRAEVQAEDRQVRAWLQETQGGGGGGGLAGVLQTLTGGAAVRVASVSVRQAEAARRRQAESETRLLSVVESLLPAAAAQQPLQPQQQHQQRRQPQPPSQEPHQTQPLLTNGGGRRNMSPRRRPPAAAAAAAAAPVAATAAPAASPPAIPTPLPVYPAPPPPEGQSPKPTTTAATTTSSVVAVPVPVPAHFPGKWTIVQEMDMMAATLHQQQQQQQQQPPPPAVAAAAPPSPLPAAALDAAAAKETFASPPPPSTAAPPTPSPDRRLPPQPQPQQRRRRTAAAAAAAKRRRLCAGLRVSVRDLGEEQEAVVVGEYRGTNPNLTGRGLWWVRVGGAGPKRLKPAAVLFPEEEDVEATGGGGGSGEEDAASEDIVDGSDDDTEDIPVRTHSPAAVVAAAAPMPLSMPPPPPQQQQPTSLVSNHHAPPPRGCCGAGGGGGGNSNRPQPQLMEQPLCDFSTASTAPPYPAGPYQSLC